MRSLPALALLLLLAAPGPLRAWDVLPPPESPRVAVAVGGSEIYDDKDDPIAVLSFHPRFSLGPLIPFAATAVSRKHGPALSLGLSMDVRILPFLSFAPAFSAGLMARSKSPECDLGGPLFFRQELALEALLPRSFRFGLAATHASNASIYSRNPGTESLLLRLSFPL